MGIRNFFKTIRSAARAGLEKISGFWRKISKQRAPEYETPDYEEYETPDYEEDDETPEYDDIEDEEDNEQPDWWAWISDVLEVVRSMAPGLAERFPSVVEDVARHEFRAGRFDIDNVSEKIVKVLEETYEKRRTRYERSRQGISGIFI